MQQNMYTYTYTTPPGWELWKLTAEIYLFNI
jgi:hypothetical protein